MRNAVVAFVVTLTAMLASCGVSHDVAFREGKNYFVRNDVSKTGVVKLTSQDEFEKVFGMATTMGNGGQPTAIDFDKEFVVARLFGVTNASVSIGKKTLAKNGTSDELTLGYEMTEGEKMSYSTLPFFMLIVDNKYKNYGIVDGGRK